MDIIVLDGYALNPGDLSWSPLEKQGRLKVYERTAPEEVISRIGHGEIILTNKTPITKEVIQQCPGIQYIGVLATGYNIVDVAEAKKHGITVTNIPAYGTLAVAQHTFALLLDLCLHTREHHQAVQAGRWTSNSDFCFWEHPLIEIMGKTMGIVGYGKIGRAVARIAEAFGMRVLVCGSKGPCPEQLPQNITTCTIDELLKQSDVISLHCPLTQATEGMINKDSIAKMKKTAILINTARGGLIVEEDLATALNQGTLYGAAVDVVSLEPIKKDNPLLTAQNCIITPHIAWCAFETRQRLMEIAIQNVSRFLNGQPTNTV